MLENRMKVGGWRFSGFSGGGEGGWVLEDVVFKQLTGYFEFYQYVEFQPLVDMLINKWLKWLYFLILSVAY